MSPNPAANALTVSVMRKNCRKVVAEHEKVSCRSEGRKKKVSLALRRFVSGNGKENDARTSRGWYAYSGLTEQ